MKMSNKVYDVLKYLALVGFPVISGFIAKLGDIWQWSQTGNIVATISAVGFLLGGLLQVSSSNYKKANTSEKEAKPNGK